MCTCGILALVTLLPSLAPAQTDACTMAPSEKLTANGKPQLDDQSFPLSQHTSVTATVTKSTDMR